MDNGYAPLKKHRDRRTRTRIDAELDAIFADTLFPATMVLGGLYSVFAVFHLFLLEAPFSYVMSGLSAISAVCILTLGLAIQRHAIKPRHTYIAGFAIVLLVLLNSGLHMWGTGQLYQSTNFALIFAGIGLFFLSRRWLLLNFAVTALVWAVLAIPLGGGEELRHYGIMNLQAMAIGALAHELRVRTHIRMNRMTKEAAMRESKLADALKQAQFYAAVERENKAKTEFLANMSHELRTPLNAIIGFSEVMSQEILGPVGNKKYREYAGNIFEAGQHLLSLVNDILDLSRIQLDAQSLDIQPIDFMRVCENCLSIVRPRAERGQVRLTFHPPAIIPVIETDERRLKQVLINLLINAVKFTYAGGSVELCLQATAEGGAVLSVIDTGIGMSEDDLENALKPFWQADAGLDRVYEGTGLGLPLVSELLRVMHGTLTLESEPGKGTVATVALPKYLRSKSAAADNTAKTAAA